MADGTSNVLDELVDRLARGERPCPECANLTAARDCGMCGYRFAGPAPSSISEPADPALYEVQIADVLTTPARPHPHFIAQILPARVVTLLAGHGGIGKSFILLLMAAHLATGRNFAGLAVTKSRVLVVSLEDDGQTLRNRIRAICEVHAIDPAELAQNLRVFDASDAGPLMAERVLGAGVKELADTALMDHVAELAQGCDVLMVDNASDALDASENERRTVRAFLRRLRSLVKDQGGAVLLLAHINKAGARERSAEDYSGSTAWNNSVRSRLALTTEADQPKLEHQKANLGPRLVQPICFARSMNGAPVILDAAPSGQAQNRTLADDAAILTAIRDAWNMGQPVTASDTGRKTTTKVLPALLNPPIPINRMRDALIRLEQSGQIEGVAIRVPSIRKDRVFFRTEGCCSDPFAPNAPNAPNYWDLAHSTQPEACAPNAPMPMAGGVGGGAAHPYGANCQDRTGGQP